MYTIYIYFKNQKPFYIFKLFYSVHFHRYRDVRRKQGKERPESEYLPLRLIQPPSIEANYNGELSERTNDNSRMNRPPS